ncbi:MAG: hypothetical protein AAGF67_03020 [Verrucomicrobiota bacterium]
MLFLVGHFEADPLHRFWDLDETLGEYALPILERISELENSVSG